MFTGIVSEIGTVKEATPVNGGRRITVACGLQATDLGLGASVSCAGACLTVVKSGSGTFAAELSAETLARTAAHHWQKGAKLNLEAAMRLGDSVSGHLVTGHIDSLAHIVEINPAGDSHVLTLEAPENLAKFIAPKGSVTLDGVSLTVNTVEKRRFTVNIIPHTWKTTTFHERKPGDVMNLEIDLIARYVERLMQTETK